MTPETRGKCVLLLAYGLLWMIAVGYALTYEINCEELAKKYPDSNAECMKPSIDRDMTSNYTAAVIMCVVFGPGFVMMAHKIYSEHKNSNKGDHTNQ